MSSTGEITLVDFGVAVEYDSNNPLFGQNTPSTIEYLPPETLLHSMYYKESDVYAFGALMYELLAERDFAVFKSYKHIDAIVNKRYRPSLEGLGHVPELKALIEMCWQDQWQKRPSFEEICGELNKVVCRMTVR